MTSPLLADALPWGRRSRRKETYSAAGTIMPRLIARRSAIQVSTHLPAAGGVPGAVPCGAFLEMP